MGRWKEANSYPIIRVLITFAKEMDIVDAKTPTFLGHTRP